MGFTGQPSDVFMMQTFAPSQLFFLYFFAVFFSQKPFRSKSDSRIPASMLQQGMKVMLADLQSSVDLNGQEGVLGTYMHDRQRWVVELAGGRTVNVREDNIRTMDSLAQDFYRAFGYPDKHTRALADMVEERKGKYRPYLIATEPIYKGTFARDVKHFVSMTRQESEELGLRFERFANQAVSEILQEDISIELQQRNWNCPPTYLLKCLQEEWLEKDLVQDFMGFDYYSDQVLQETMARLSFEGVLWLEFWSRELPDLPADTLWRFQTGVLMSHAFLEDRILTLGTFCKAKCNHKRLAFYEQRQRGEKPAPLCSTGNIMDVTSWLRPTHVGPGQIAADSCIVFLHDVRAGQQVRLDYGADYFLSPDKQLCKTCPAELRPVLFHIAGRFDPRVAEALEAHMRA
jgi:hypothetical protein